jgi:hypothetical protein
MNFQKLLFDLNLTQYPIHHVILRPQRGVTMSEQARSTVSAGFRNGRKSFRDRDVITTDPSNLFLAPVPCLSPRHPPSPVRGPGSWRSSSSDPQATTSARDRWIEVRNPMSSPPLTPRERNHIVVGELNKQQQITTTTNPTIMADDDNKRSDCSS